MSPEVTRIQDLLKRDFGFLTDEVSSVVSVGTTPVRVLAPNPRRAAVSFTQLGTGTIYGDITPTPSATRGIALAQNNTIFFWWREDFALPTQEWYFVGTAAGQTLYIIEFILVKEV